MKITDPKTLSNYLRNERKTLGLSQAKVADLVGLRQGTVSKFESAPDKMQLDTLFRLLSALELELYVRPKESKNKNNKWTEDW
ncbi:helix-turn-helix domain-containing protein [Aliidiomarina quisquiliarum]|uniref:helix-turn-helix domain-containing protein n=1 Tax=Aliidiomarina quisquiliarum TaxID=2938947 RepID=UPI00208E391D|nr:helix-turn-helix domain-containing protein [Aliidiomarina quisquiliarum]MCO4320960.1 helix-turn-helix domain-containing protein [Aliidiomarina quisquiliarum]